MTTGAPNIRLDSVCSVPPMWNIGDQAMKLSSRSQGWSTRLEIARAIMARWLITAAFGRPVVPLV